MKPQQNVRHRESGFALVSVIVTAGVIGIITFGTFRLINQQVDLVKIARMQQRMDLLVDKVRNAATSRGAMKKTSQMNPGSRLAACLIQKKCSNDDFYETLTFYDALGKPVSGLFTLSGENCERNCTVEVQTESRLVCARGIASCENPSEIKTRYTIRKASAELFKGRHFAPISGEVSFSTFICPDDQYVRGFTSDGQIVCDSAFSSVHSTTCPAGTAAVGVDPQGFIKCQEITDYCNSSMGISVVIDNSSSMKRDNSMSIVRTEMATMLSKLDSTRDMVAISQFDAGSKLLLPRSIDFGKAQSTVNSIVTGSGTNMSAGLLTGGQALDGYAAGKKIMLFMSDGRNNRPGDPVAIAQSLKNQGFRIISVGYSARADQAMLQSIASSPKDFHMALNQGELNAIIEDISTMICR